MDLSLQELFIYFNFDIINYIKSGIYSFAATAFAIIVLGIMAIAKRYINNILAFFGIDYLIKRDQEIREFVSDVIELKGHFQADSIQVFRTSNGKKYVADENTKNIRIKRINGKPIDAFPESLETDMFSELLQLSLKNEWKYISTNDLLAINRGSKILPILTKNKISYIFIFRITDYNRIHEGTYGFMLFMWVNKPNFDELFTSKLSNWLESLNIGFIKHVESLFLEKFMRTKI